MRINFKDIGENIFMVVSGGYLRGFQKIDKLS